MWTRQSVHTLKYLDNLEYKCLQLLEITNAFISVFLLIFLTRLRSYHWLHFTGKLRIPESVTSYWLNMELKMLCHQHFLLLDYFIRHIFPKGWDFILFTHFRLLEKLAQQVCLESVLQPPLKTSECVLL